MSKIHFGILFHFTPVKKKSSTLYFPSYKPLGTKFLVSDIKEKF